MKTIDLDIQYAEYFALKQYEALKDKSVTALTTLDMGTGAGNDFLGWQKLPSETPADLLDRINKTAARLRANGQIAFQYADAEGDATLDSPANPNGSTEAIEGIISPDGRILGKMGHSERWADGLMKNIAGNKEQNIFRNAVNYFRKK